MIITIDPGVRGAGVAAWGADLSLAGYVKAPPTGRGYEIAEELAYNVECFLRGYEPKLILVEYPVIYPGMPQKDLNDLLDVVAAGSAIATRLDSMLSHIETVFPSQWKGNVKKQVMLERIRSKLTPEESARVEWTNKSDNEDILDAIGIGLWHFKRLNSKSYPGAT